MNLRNYFGLVDSCQLVVDSTGRKSSASTTINYLLSTILILSRLINLRFANSRLCLLLFAICSLPFAFSIQAQTIYTGADGGDWFTVTNWSNGLPALGNDATVPSGKTVVISQVLTVNFNIQSFGGITNNSVLTLATNLVSGGLITNSGTLTVNSGITLTSSGGINNSGTINNNGNTNSNSVFTNLATGLVNNNNTWTQQAAITNGGSFCANAGTFTCPQVFTNNAIVKVLTGATFKVDFGGSYSNATGSSLTNAGNFSNLGAFLNTTTVTNTGTFTNNSSHTCNGIFNNESGGSLINTSTININGRINNKIGGTVNNSFNFNVNANGYFSNAGAFTNGNTITILLGGTYVNEATGVVTTNFGSSIVDSGYLKNSLGGQIVGNGSIKTTKKFDNLGLVDAQGGSQITIGDTLNNTGTFSVINIFTNNGCVLNSGILNLNSGGTVVNNLKFVNLTGGKFTNAFEYYNKVGATTTNNGNFTNNIRVFNDGSFTNNAYLLDAGDFFNRLGATLTNTELIEVNQGSIVNDGTIVNSKSIYLDQCSVFTNRAAVNNTGGAINSSAIVFQRGTITGNAINKITGFIQTALTSAAAICRPSLSTGTDLIGEAKVYGQNPVLSTLGIDSCAGFQYFIENTTRKVFTCAQVGTTITGHFTLLVRTGDSLTCTLPITIFDGVAPVFASCPSDVEVLSKIDSATYSWGTLIATDNCGAAPSIVTNIASGSFFKLGTTSVVVTARDASNNARDCRFNVTVVKVPDGGVCSATSAAPAFVNCPANISVSMPFGNAAATWSEPTVTGACLPIAVTQSAVSGAIFPSGATTVTYSAKDVNNKVGTCSFIVTVTSVDLCATDNIAPVISNCPSNIFVPTNTIINGAVAIWKTPTATDNCGAATLTANQISGSVFPVGVTTVTYTAKDVKTNSSTCNFTINVGTSNPCVGDVTPPIVSGCPANITQTTTASTAFVTWIEPTATDACAPVLVNKSNLPGSSFQIGTTKVSYYFSDKVGNTSICSFNVTLTNSCFNDTIAPVLGACPANITVTTSTTSATATWTNPTATDNCSTATVVSAPTSGSNFALGVNTVTVSAVDGAGNKKSCTFTVTVNSNPCLTDVTPPVLGVCPANITVTTAGTSAIAAWTNPTATDNCSTPIVTSSSLSGSSFNVGVNTVTVTATDAKGNKSTCSFTVTVSSTACVPSITRTVSNSKECSKGITFSIYLNTQYYTVTNATFTENADGTAKLTATTSLGAVNINFTGRTTSGSPVFNTGCFTPTSTADWYFYSDFSGTIGSNAVVSNPMHKFQVGTSANNHNQNVYGGSGWFAGSKVSGDLNFLFSGNTATLNQITCPPPVCTTKGTYYYERWMNVNYNWTQPIVLPTTTANDVMVQNTMDLQMPEPNKDVNYLSRGRGYITAPESGDYYFNLTGDDYTEFFLSPSTDATKAQKISYFYGWTYPNEYTKYPTQTSTKVTLVAGQLYYFDLRHFQGWGGDDFHVSWKKPSNPNIWVVVPSANLSFPCNMQEKEAQNKNVFNFDASASNRQAHINWLSNAGVTTDYYTVERLNASAIFESLYAVSGFNGTNKIATYNFIDIKAAEGDNFYRIRTTYKDGTETYSEVKKVTILNSVNGFAVFPNPTDDYLDIDLANYEGKSVDIAIYNTVGQQVYKYYYESAPRNTHRVNTDGFALGAHLVKVDVKGIQTQTKQFVIAR